MIPDQLLPDVFAALMALAILMYAILDGYDLGVGMLLPLKKSGCRDTMIASIGPFWDANETWLVMAVGVLLIAFPHAHSLVLGELYIPIVLLLVGLILRGVAFDFRAKAHEGNQRLWDKYFKFGSLLAAASQGYMLGMYVMGFENSFQAYAFALLSSFGVIAAYCLIGACWLLMKCEGSLQLDAKRWALKSLYLTVLGIALVCVINPLVNPNILHKWFSKQGLLLLGLIPPMCFYCLYKTWEELSSSSVLKSEECFKPFSLIVSVFVLCFCGLGYSFYPYIVPGHMLLRDTAAAPESLRFILWGAMIVLPIIIAYTAFSYRVFRGKVTELKYY